MTLNKKEELKKKDTHIAPTLRNIFFGNIWDYYPSEIINGIIQGVERLNFIIPGINSSHNLIYSPEIKFRSIKINLEKDFSCCISGLYFAGDGSGHTGDIIHSSMMGWMIGERLLKNE